ncbi:MAG: hypothetical protein Q9191_000283 [Dirinaria sp. TL-2023a]
MVEAFLAMFRSMHPGQCGSTELSFRLRLLRFTAMFTSRFTPKSPIDPPITELLKLRRQNKQRADAFHHGKDMRDMLDSENVGASEQRLTASEREGETLMNNYRASGDFSLLDTLPNFMSLSAAQSVLQDRPITDIWMRLAAGYMAHSALEQCLKHDVPLSNALEEAFAWGFDPESTAEEGSDEWQVNAMFLGEDDEIFGWSEIRNEHMRTLKPPSGIPLVEHAKSLLRAQLPLDTFEQNLMMFVEGLLEAQPKPLYVQLEMGKVDGLSREDTRALAKAIGMD